MSNATRQPMSDDDLLRNIRRLVDLSFYSLIPLTLAFLVVGIAANSLTVMSIAVDYGLSFVVQIFAFQSIRTIQKSNIIRFPYGTGRLENFSGFLYGALAIPTSAYILYFAVSRILTPSFSVSFSIAQIPMLPSLVRSLVVFWFARQLLRRTDSPIVESYFLGAKVATLFDIGVILAIATAWALVHTGHAVIAYYIDPAVSMVLAIYMLYMGISLTVGNFKILVDLPLPESEQLKIMSVLAKEFASNEDVGHVYTRRSGRRRFIDIELYLRPDVTVAGIMELRARMQKHLDAHFDDVRFALIPLPYNPDGVPIKNGA